MPVIPIVWLLRSCSIYRSKCIHVCVYFNVYLLGLTHSHSHPAILSYRRNRCFCIYVYSLLPIMTQSCICTRQQPRGNMGPLRLCRKRYDAHAFMVILLSPFRLGEDDLSHFADCLRTHRCHKLGWPKGMTESLYDRTCADVRWQHFSFYKYPSVPKNAQVGIGFLLKEMWKVSSKPAK